MLLRGDRALGRGGNHLIVNPSCFTHKQNLVCVKLALLKTWAVGKCMIFKILKSDLPW